MHSPGVKTLATCGCMTDFCSEIAASAAHETDYFVDFIADATGAPDQEGEYRQPAIILAVCATFGAGVARILGTDEPPPSYTLNA